MLSIRRCLIIGLIMGLVAPVAHAADSLEGNPFAHVSHPDAARYRACMAQTGENPAVALEAARLWREHEGGVPAKHCIAVALLALDRFEEAAAWFDEAADDVAANRGLGSRGATGGVALAGALRGQAGNAWMLARDYRRAYGALTNAVALMPTPSAELNELLIDRARAAAGLGGYDQAVEDLTLVIERQPSRVEAYVLRATAHRYRGALDEAEYDIARAIALDPRDGSALLERGILKRLGGDDAGARRDWERVVELHAGTDVGEIALDNLELLSRDE